MTAGKRSAGPGAPWFIYMIRCGDGTLYTGITIDVRRRLAEHREGRGAKYLRGRGPLVLVYRKRVSTRGEALREECRIKKLSREQKELLSRGYSGRPRRCISA